MPDRRRSRPVGQSCRTGLVVALAFTGLLSQAACVPVLIGGAAAGGYALAQERSPADSIKDLAIRAQISQSWKDFRPELSEDLDATVYIGRVLITGRVPSEAWRDEAVKRAWRIEGVREVDNEIQVGPDAGFWQDARDTTVSTRLRAEIVADPYVRSVNYIVTTVEGVVYIIGSARSQEELNRVTNHARNMSNVRRVVSYVRIRPGEPPRPGDAGNAPPPPPNYQTPAPPPPSNGAPPPDYAPTPRQSIEVTPLQ